VNADSAEPDRAAGNPRGILARVIQLLSTRIELLGFEFAEERRNAVQVLLLVITGAALGIFGVALLVGAGILALDPAWRPLGAGLAGLACTATAAALLLRVRRLLRERPMPFAATVAELKRDRQWLETLK
jgi:uncharacterized membrane protein YqjE